MQFIADVSRYGEAIVVRIDGIAKDEPAVAKRLAEATLRDGESINDLHTTSASHGYVFRVARC